MTQKTAAPQPTILVVEDNEDLREAASLVLTMEGYQVFSAADGQDAMDILKSGQCMPDLIVSDIAMPRMDGYEFFEAIHKIPELKVIPFIFLTARGSRLDIRFGRQLGVDDYLVKPFESDDFLAAVENKLRRAREIRDHAEDRLNDARRAMVQLIAHELRTPLTYVIGGFSLLSDSFDQSDLPPDMKVIMNLIQSGTQRLNRIAEQAVLYGELASGHAKALLDTQGEPHNATEILERALGNARRDFSLPSDSARIVVENHLPADVELFGSAEQLTTSIYEVLRNSISYSAADTQITLSSAQDKGQIVIVIVDHGRGIPKEDQTLIWDVMGQSERHKHEQQGVGMGLPLVKQIATAHNGTVNLTSEEGTGTTVTLRFPIYAGKPADTR